MKGERRTAISLFTSGGIGDLAIRAAGYDILVSNELHEDRHAVFAHNFPETTAITGDVREHTARIVEATRERLDGRPLDLLYATPPCQGMSKNGRGKLLNAVRSGRKPAMDERNRLIVPTMTIARELRPSVVLLENVPEMEGTLIVDDDGELVSILDFIASSLGDDYVGRAEVVEFADYGVPQCRQRLITVFTRDERLKQRLEEAGSLLPRPTHSESGSEGTRPWVTLREALADVPPLDARDADSARHDTIPFHRVPLLDEMKSWWVSHTPPERSAFDNQCVACGHDGNPTHVARRNAEGINRASSTTPVYCERCGELLPRPSVETADGRRRLMKGFTSAYKRMSYDRPASALTRNLSYACSDNKLHPEEHRVLSLYEAFRVHTVDRYDHEWQRADGRKLNDKTVREIIGESIPPAGLETIVRFVTEVSGGLDRPDTLDRPWSDSTREPAAATVAN